MGIIRHDNNMIKIIADLQLHSKYSRAVSQQMEIPKIWEWARIKGINLIATGDWTHPIWMREIKANLEEMGNGLLKLKKESIPFNLQDSGVNTDDGPFFLLATEVSSIYSQGGKLRRIHNLIWSPSLKNSDKIIEGLKSRGANLHSDGRPIVGLTSMEIAEIVFSVDSHNLLIPAHAWTPWFSLYGSQSGFDSIDECFGSFAKNIYAIETGLSSDPAMNWRIKDLDNRTLLSFSDAHSGPKLGREATVFELSKLSYENIRSVIAGPYTSFQKGEDRDIDNKIIYTIEFHPEEGKYHYTGHRNCNIKQSPSETKAKGTICPVCGKKLTVGVMQRVEELAGRSEEELRIVKKKLPGTVLEGIYAESFPQKPPYVMFVPLLEILSESMNVSPASQSVQSEYKKLTDQLGSEFSILLEKPLDEIKAISGEKTAEAIGKVRSGDIFVDPGYDGVFGVVKIWFDKKKDEKVPIEEKEQLSFF